MSHWNVFSNHGHVLLFLARDPDARLRDVAASVGITERAVQKIMRDMQESGVISVSKHGRRNRYAIDVSAPLRHDLESHRTVGDLIALIAEGLPTEPLSAPRTGPTAPPVRPRERPRVASSIPAAQSPEPPARSVARAASDGTAGATGSRHEAAKERRSDRESGRESPREPLRESGRKTRLQEEPESKGAAKTRSKRKPASAPPDDGEQGSLF